MQIRFRKNIRLKGYDYSTDGYYFVTIVTRDRLPLLKPSEDAIESIIKDLPKFIDGLSIDYFNLMDNHIHIIFILKDCLRPLGRVVSAMKSAITKVIAANVNLQKVDSHQPLPIWQRNYYEHIIRNEESLQKIREYIDNNPLAEMIDWKDLEVSLR